MQQREIVKVLLLALLLATPLRAEWVAGYEGDDRRGLGYLTRVERKPLGRDRQLVFWGTASYLFYDVVQPQGTTRVTSPGLGAGVVYKWIYPKLEFGLGPGYEYRWTSRKLPSGLELDEKEHGPHLQGDLTYRFSPGTDLTLQSSYSDANEWLYAGGRYLLRISDSLRAGPEANFQGNDDVDVASYGGIVEIPFQEQTALQFHAGQSRSRYSGGITEERPYYSFGIVRSFW